MYCQYFTRKPFKLKDLAGIPSNPMIRKDRHKKKSANYHCGINIIVNKSEAAAARSFSRPEAPKPGPVPPKQVILNWTGILKQ